MCTAPLVTDNWQLSPLLESHAAEPYCGFPSALKDENLFVDCSGFAYPFWWSLPFVVDALKTWLRAPKVLER